MLGSRADSICALAHTALAPGRPTRQGSSNCHPEKSAHHRWKADYHRRRTRLQWPVPRLRHLPVTMSTDTALTPLTKLPDDRQAPEPEPKLYAIRQVVSKHGSVSWRVSMVRRGRSFARAFSLKRHGSREAAIAASVAYRDGIIKQYTMVSKRENHVILRARNRSGVPGVFLAKSHGSPSWVASIAYENRRSTSKTFSIAKYGARQAFELATQARARMLAMVVDRRTIRKQADPAVALAPVQVVTAMVVPPSYALPRPVHTTSCDVLGVFRFMYRRKRPDGSVWETAMWAAEYRWPERVLSRKVYAVSRFGEDAAKQMALAQLAAWQLNPPAPPVQGAPRKRNGSRKPVCEVQRKLQRSRSQAGGPDNAYWQAIYRFTDDGQQRTATFSVTRYGEEEALRLATQCCAQWQREPPPKQALKTARTR